MPADYNSTAQALALPISPERSPIFTPQALRPPWTRLRQKQSSRRRQSASGGRVSVKDKLLDSAVKIQSQIYKIIKRLTPLQRVLTGIALVLAFVLALLFLVFNERIFAWLEPVAEKWKNLNGGWLILWAMTVTTAFPPVIGYSTCVTLAGFVYGFPNGWFIVATANVVGSLCSFIVSRTLLSNFVNRLVANDTRFEALALVLKHDGLKLLCMIRLCPLPYSLSNGAISTFPTVEPLQFALATAITCPKLLIHVFIGSRLAVIARSGEKMDTKTKAINYTSIALGAVLGIATGWIIYQRTLARSRQLQGEERTSLHRPTQRGVDDPLDPEAHPSAAVSTDDDDIDFLDDEEPSKHYQDDFTDDDDVFRNGDGDAEDAFGLHRQPSGR